jgi:hypothetical protein
MNPSLNGVITDVEVNEFWTRIALNPWKGIKKAKVRANSSNFDPISTSAEAIFG